MKSLRFSVNLKVAIGIIALMMSVGVIGLKVFDATNKKSAAEHDSILTYRSIVHFQDMRLDIAHLVDFEHDYSRSFEETVRESYEEALEELVSDSDEFVEFLNDPKESHALVSVIESIPDELNMPITIESEAEDSDEVTEKTVYERAPELAALDDADEMLMDQIKVLELRLEENKILAEQKQSELIWWIIFGTILCSSMAVLTAMIVVIYITRPLVRLNNAIDGISKGDLSIEISKKLLGKNDEIGDLAQSFDRTMVSLKLAIKRGQEEK